MGYLDILRYQGVIYSLAEVGILKESYYSEVFGKDQITTNQLLCLSQLFLSSSTLGTVAKS